MAISTFGLSCTKFVYPGCWHFDDDITSKIDDDLTEHGGIPHTPGDVKIHSLLLK